MLRSRYRAQSWSIGSRRWHRSGITGSDSSATMWRCQSSVSWLRSASTWPGWTPSSRPPPSVGRRLAPGAGGRPAGHPARRPRHAASCQSRSGCVPGPAPPSRPDPAGYRWRPDGSAHEWCPSVPGTDASVPTPRVIPCPPSSPRVRSPPPEPVDAATISTWPAHRVDVDLGLPRRSVERGEAQERLVGGGGPDRPLPLRAGSPRGSPGRGDHRRNRVPEEGHPFGRGGAAVQQHGRAGGELPSGESSWPTRGRGGTRNWTRNSTGSRSGPTSRYGCRQSAWPRTRPLPPSRNWPSGC